MYGMGLINWVRDRIDRRVVKLELTDKGSLLVPVVRYILSQADERLHECLSRDGEGCLKAMQAIYNGVAIRVNCGRGT